MAQGKRDRLSTEQRIDMWRRWKVHHKIYFDLFDERLRVFRGKHTAYVSIVNIANLHRGNCYRVKFNSDLKNPIVEEIIEALPCNEPKAEAKG